MTAPDANGSKNTKPRKDNLMAKKEKAVNVYLLLDRSGSMASRWDETLGAVNGYVKALAKEKATKAATVTIATFDGVAGLQFDVLREGVSVNDWKNLTNADAAPRGVTPLFDAIGRLSAIVDKDAPKKAVIAVMTDGHENDSREMSKDAAKGCFDRMRDKKFQIVFLGADFDAFGQAAIVGTAAAQTLNMTAGNYKHAAASLAASTAAYASKGRAMAWSDEDRKRARGGI